MSRPYDLLIFDWGEPDQTICLEWQIVPASARPWMAGPGVREPLPSRQGWLEQNRP